MNNEIYFIDCSSLIDAKRYYKDNARYYPKTNLKIYWNTINDLIKGGILKLHRYVFVELAKKDTYLKQWSSQYKPLEVKPTQFQTSIVGDLEPHFPQKVNYPGADLFVIAAAIESLQNNTTTFIVSEDTGISNACKSGFIQANPQVLLLDQFMNKIFAKRGSLLGYV